MDQVPKIGIVGGDLRYLYLSDLLAKDYTVYLFGLERPFETGAVRLPAEDLRRICECDVVLLPLPAVTDGQWIPTPYSDTRIGVYDVLQNLGRGALLLGGMVEPSFTAYLQELGCEIQDYYQREELAVLNAIPTAEGAIAIAMEELPVTIWQCPCLVTGYGRVAKALSQRLVALGAQVTIAARRHSDLAWAEESGCKSLPVSMLPEKIREFRLVFNTVPAVILGESTLRQMDPKTLLIDLASKPGGVDFNTAKELGIKTIWALSLPGKAAPQTAAQILKRTILNIAKERGKL